MKTAEETQGGAEACFQMFQYITYYTRVLIDPYWPKAIYHISMEMKV